MSIAELVMHNVTIFDKYSINVRYYHMCRPLESKIYHHYFLAYTTGCLSRVLLKHTMTINMETKTTVLLKIGPHQRKTVSLLHAFTACSCFACTLCMLKTNGNERKKTKLVLILLTCMIG